MKKKKKKKTQIKFKVQNPKSQRSPADKVSCNCFESKQLKNNKLFQR